MTKTPTAEAQEALRLAVMFSAELTETDKRREALIAGRRGAISRARDGGCTVREIAAALGLNPSRIGQLGKVTGPGTP